MLSCDVQNRCGLGGAERPEANGYYLQYLKGDLTRSDYEEATDQDPTSRTSSISLPP